MFVDTLCGKIGPSAVFGVRLHPRRHRRAGGERFPAAAKPAGARGAAHIEDLMRDLGMRTVDTTVEMAVENDAAANTGTYRDVDEPGLLTARAPGGFAKRARVGIVLHSNGNVELTREIVNG